MKTLCEDLRGCGKTRLTSQQTVHSSSISVALVTSWAAHCSECKELWGHTNTFRVWHPQLPTLGVLPGEELETHLLYDPAITLLSIHPKDPKSAHPRDPYTSVDCGTIHSS